MINFAIAVTTAVLLVERLIRYYDTVVAGCACLLVLVLNVAFPFAVQWLIHALAQRIATIQPRPADGPVDPPRLLSLDVRVAATPQGGAKLSGCGHDRFG